MSMKFKPIWFTAGMIFAAAAVISYALDAWGESIVCSIIGGFCLYMDMKLILAKTKDEFHDDN